MPQLMTAPDKKVLLSDLKVADTMWTRNKGLLGTQTIQDEQGLWIHRCNSIHTFFMNFTIDCVFLDKKLRVKALVKNVKPGRIVFPIWGARTVVEMKSGRIEQLGLKIGDELYVGA